MVDNVDGIFGMERDMDTVMFFSLMRLIRRFHAKWYPLTSEPVAAYGLTPYNAENEMIRDLCQG
jgi:hypothetical protein